MPLTIHDDAGPFAKGKSCSVLSWSPLLGTGTDYELKFPCFSEIKGSGANPGCGAAWEYVLSVFDNLAQGLDAGGNPLPPDDDGVVWKFVLIFGKGDCEQLAHWGCPMYADGDTICAACLANRTDIPWSDLRKAARWRFQLLSNAVFLSRTKGDHPLAKSHYWSKFFIRFDPMHILDHHGVANVMTGSVLHECCADSRLGPNREARLAVLNASLKSFQQRFVVNSRLPPLRLENLMTNGWAETSSPVIKAANTRQAMPWVESIARKYFDRGTPEDLAKINTVSHLNGVYHVLYSGDMFLTDSQHTQLQDHLVKCGKNHMYARQCAAARVPPVNRWQVKPKSHYAQHLADQSLVISSRYTQCYAEESLIGRMTKLWKSSCSGMYKKHIQKNVCLKYLIRFAIVFDL